MLKFLQYFLIAMTLYFIAHTFLVFGILDGQYKEIVSSAKELVWLAFIAIIAVTNRSAFRTYLSKTRVQIIILSLFLLL